MITISEFLRETGAPIPDNNTSDTPVAARVKQILVEELGVSPDAVVNEARLRQDLDMYDLERLDFQIAWMHAFGFDSAFLNKLEDLDSHGMDLMMFVGTVGEIVALTEWLLQQKRLQS